MNLVGYHCFTCDNEFAVWNSCVRCPKCGESTLGDKRSISPSEKIFESATEEAYSLLEKGYGNALPSKTR